MKIGIDIMGGDFAPQATVMGSILAQKELPQGVKLVLFGDETSIKEQINANQGNEDDFEIVHCSQSILMSDHPAKAFKDKADSGIVKGFQHLKTEKIQGFASAGNTGAMMVGAMLVIQPIEGILRPCITASFPTIDGKQAVLVDVGLNADVKPEILYQYAILGSKYAEKVLHVENPRVALLNIGEESEKGNILSKASHELMKGSKDFNFIGNLESNRILFGKADVIVCDGFTGNILLKQAEGFFAAIRKRQIQDEYFDRFNYENYGGTPVLGINAPVCIGHGISNDQAIKNMILHTYEVAKSNLSKTISQTLQSV